MALEAVRDFKAVKAAITMEQVLEHYGILDKFKRGTDSLSGPCPRWHRPNGNAKKSPTRILTCPSAKGIYYFNRIRKTGAWATLSPFLRGEGNRLTRRNVTTRTVANCVSSPLLAQTRRGSG